MTVGGPRPFEGYTTSDFFYTGFGVSQEIPGPGKLGVRAAVAEKEADAVRFAAEAVARRVVSQVRAIFYEIFYLERSLALLAETRAALEQAAEVAGERYRVGTAPQQDVTRAQAQLTAILRDVEMKREELEHHQVELKTVLGRSIDTPDIAVGEIEPSQFTLSEERAQELARAAAPELKTARAIDQRSDETLRLARREFLPDFRLGYTVQVTGPGFRNYYVWTLGAKVPLYFWRRQTPALEQAALEKEAARSELRERGLAVASETHHQWIAAKTAERLMTIYRDGLIPQMRANREAALAAYRTGQVDFATLVAALIDVLTTNEEYYRTLANREVAIAKLKEIIGDEL